MTDDDRMVTVCDSCFCASCWHGIFMCDVAKTAGTIDLPVRELRRMNREHPSYYSDEAVRRVRGS